MPWGSTFNASVTAAAQQPALCSGHTPALLLTHLWWLGLEEAPGCTRGQGWGRLCSLGPAPVPVLGVRAPTTALEISSA